MYVQRLGIFDIDQFDKKKIGSYLVLLSKKVCERLLIEFLWVRCCFGCLSLVCHQKSHCQSYDF